MSYHWFKIFESDEEIKNCIQEKSFVNFQFKGEKICITQSQNKFYAFQEKCPHNGANLSQGFCSNKNEIICPLHRYSFDLSTGKATSGSGFAIKTYPIKFESDGVFLGIKASWWEM